MIKNIYSYLCTTLRNLFGRPKSRKVKRIFLSTKRVYQHLGYTVSRISDSHMKTEVFKLSFLERKKSGLMLIKLVKMGAGGLQ